MGALPRFPIGFAHRGARARAPENTIEAFRLALALEASGLESDVWLTADGIPVLDHDGIVRVSGRRRAVGELRKDELPSRIPTLADLYEACGADYELSLDVKDPAAAPVVVQQASFLGTLDRLWLCHEDWRQVARWRQLSPDVRLVDSTRLVRIAEGPARRAAMLADAGVDAVNLHRRDWSRPLVETVHEHGRAAFAWDAQRRSVIARLVAMGVDAVYSDHVEVMMAALTGAG
ncbi:MAG TPA: glycerophosphodiester phosphodiesterase [Acidimicrobiales bacterium]|nr:glycerophosphodiester phosphodiesterase [Acidimicrobiales bacterium]